MDRSKLSVSQLNNYIKGVFDDELILKNIFVYGEVSERSESGGNLYFTLKDENSVLRCVRFGGGASVEVGEAVLVSGSVNFYAKGGRVSFAVRTIEPYGDGKLSIELRLLRERLISEGLFDNRPPLPVFVETLGVITSETGAVIHDICSVLEKRHGYVKVTVYPAKVQGEGADDTIVSALSMADGKHDLLVVARGGGSAADLSVFDSEKVARAVAGAKTPIISAVGHEVDNSLCDLAASLRAGTPSIAAENVCRINEAYFGAAIALARRMTAAVNAGYNRAMSRTLRLAYGVGSGAESRYYAAKNRLFEDLRRMESAENAALERAEKAAADTRDKLFGAAESLAARAGERVAALAGRLDAASPLGILEKGYAKVYKGNAPLGSVTELKAGDEIDIYARDGAVRAKTLAVRPSATGGRK